MRNVEFRIAHKPIQSGFRFLKWKSFVCNEAVFLFPKQSFALRLCE